MTAVDGAVREIVRDELNQLLERVVLGEQLPPREARRRAGRYDGPCTVAEVERFAGALRRLLDSLGWEIVVSAFLGEGESDLLYAEGQEADRVRKFLDGRISMRPQSLHLRGRALAVLDTFADHIESAAKHSDSPSLIVDTASVGDRSAAGDELRAHTSAAGRYSGGGRP